MCAAYMQGDYITVYDMSNSQSEFDDNGICVLCPTRCETTEELNGMCELVLEHPIDLEGRWKHLLELNIIKAKGQLFRIYKKGTKQSSDGSMLRTVNARHIFYDLNDKLLLDVRPENKNGNDFLTYILSRTYDDDPNGYYQSYDFVGTSDIEEKATAYYVGKSVTAAILGEDNCFVNRLGGELYRDNFRFSIDKRREGAKDDAFAIRYGVDMIEVEESVDYSSMATYLIAKDNFNHELEIFYEDNARLAHHITRSVQFEYENDDESVFKKDAQNYFESSCVPKINYKITFANLKNADIYSDFLGLQEYNVGDSGKIYNEVLGIETEQKIIKKTVDVLTGNTTSVELGNLQSSLTRRDKYAGTIRTNDSATKAAEAAAEEARKAFASSLKTWKDCLNFTWKDLKVLKWGEVYKVQEQEEE